MKNLRQSYLGKVSVTWVLIVAGMTAGGTVCPSRTVYPLFLLLGLIPALVFICWALEETWKRFWMILAVLAVMVGVQMGLRFWGSDLSDSLLVPLAVIVAAQPFLIRTDKKGHAESAPPGDAAGPPG